MKKRVFDATKRKFLKSFSWLSSLSKRQLSAYCKRYHYSKKRLSNPVAKVSLRQDIRARNFVADSIARKKHVKGTLEERRNRVLSRLKNPHYVIKEISSISMSFDVDDFVLSIKESWRKYKSLIKDKSIAYEITFEFVNRSGSRYREKYRTRFFLVQNLFQFEMYFLTDLSNFYEELIENEKYHIERARKEIGKTAEFESVEISFDDIDYTIPRFDDLTLHISEPIVNVKQNHKLEKLAKERAKIDPRTGKKKREKVRSNRHRSNGHK
jgi:hypothetical protein